MTNQQINKTATVVVLFEGESAEHFVGVMSAHPSQEEQERIAQKLGAELDSENTWDGSDPDTKKVVSFRQVTVDSMELINIWQ